MQCSKHPEHEAAGICTYSGKPFCADELVEVNGRMYAKDNLSLAFNEAKDQAAKKASNTPVVVQVVGTERAAPRQTGANDYGHRSQSVALILCCLGFLGFAGLHRFYAGQAALGLIQLFTFGGFFVWTYLDFKAIQTGDFRDAEGKRLI